MDRIEVRSTSAKAIGYDPATQTLEIEFHGKNGEPGPVWEYSPVPQADYDEMMTPGNSIGALIASRIRRNPVINSRRVDTAEATA